MDTGLNKPFNHLLRQTNAKLWNKLLQPEKFSISVCGGFDKLIEEYGEKTYHFLTKVDCENFDKFENLLKT